MSIARKNGWMNDPSVRQEAYALYQFFQRDLKRPVSKSSSEAMEVSEAKTQSVPQAKSLETSQSTDAKEQKSESSNRIIGHESSKRMLLNLLAGLHPRIGQESSVRILANSSIFDPNSLRPIVGFLGPRYIESMAEVVDQQFHQSLTRRRYSSVDIPAIDYKPYSQKLHPILRLRIIYDVALALTQQLETKKSQLNYNRIHDVFLVENWELHWEKMLENDTPISSVRDTGPSLKQQTVLQSFRYESFIFPKQTNLTKEMKEQPEAFLPFYFGLVAYEILTGTSLEYFESIDRRNLVLRYKRRGKSDLPFLEESIKDDKNDWKASYAILETVLVFVVYECWNFDTQKRPKMASICETMGEMLKTELRLYQTRNAKMKKIKEVKKDILSTVERLNKGELDIETCCIKLMSFYPDLYIKKEAAKIDFCIPRKALSDDKDFEVICSFFELFFAPFSFDYYTTEPINFGEFFSKHLKKDICIIRFPRCESRWSDRLEKLVKAIETIKDKHQLESSRSETEFRPS